MITLNDITLNRGLKTLLSDTSAIIHPGQKLGLVGRNGCGKSSLFAAILGFTELDKGECSITSGNTTAHIAQDMPNLELSAIEFATRGHAAYERIQAAIDAGPDDETLVALYNEMSEIDGYSLPARAAKILIGLGFTQENMNNPVNSFSGGWRMRLNLARVLLSDANIILLDEPTNHLDLEAIVWLEGWIQSADATVLLISHDRQFLDNTTTHIIHIEHQKLNAYTGNYSSFEKIRAEKIRLEAASFAKQEKNRAHLQSFVDRFRAKASKAKQAQSRLKMLEKLDATAPLRDKAAVTFTFLEAKDPGSPMLSARELNIGYAASAPILKNASFTLNNHDRIGLIGPNGAGKSTLIKFLAGKLEAFSGEHDKNSQIKVGYFAQHLMDQLDIHSTALELVLSQDKRLSDGAARKLLGRYQFGSDDIHRQIASFSGGERARLVMALIIAQAPNLLLLDEPTNHLDMEVRDALNTALQTFEGATVIVSHDRFFLSSVSDQLWLVYNGQLQTFDGSIEQYQQWYMAQQKLEQANEAKTPKTKEKSSKRNKSNTKALNNKIQKAEDDLETKLFELDELNSVLANAFDNPSKMRELKAKQAALTTEIESLEEQILELIELKEQEPHSSGCF